MNKKFLILIILNLFLVSAAFAQLPAEFAAGSMNPIPNGPTTASQTAELRLNPGPGTFNSANPQIFVTASLSNQQWTGINTTPDNAVVMFGGTDNPNPGQTFARSRPTFSPMSEIGLPNNSMFSNVDNGVAVGINVNENYAFNMFTSLQQWAGLISGTGSVPATTARVYMADLTFSFNTPLTNPYLHVVAKGGRSPSLGYATELDLVTAGITLEKVVGTASLVVTPTQINNGNQTGISSPCAQNAASCGTIRLRGTNITLVTFRVYIRGDGSNSVWSNPVFHTGDQWMIAVSIPSSFTLTPGEAEISGRLSKGGEPLGRTLVVLTDTETNQRIVVRADSEGNYRFAEVRTGRAYVVEPVSNKYSFSPSALAVDLTDNVTGLNFSVESRRYQPVNDFDGDGKSDVAVYRPSEGNWFVLHSSTGQMSAFQFGAEGDQPVPGDFDGDNRSDYAVYRPSEGIWYIWQSATQSLRAERFGLATDKLVAADYDGDGKTDMAVFRDGIWYIQKSTDRSVACINFGVDTDQPVPADFDGDGMTDVGVYREGVWYILGSISGYKGFSFGLTTDNPVPADYDGDGKSDISVFRNGVWHILSSTTGYAASGFGIASDKLVQADYDGDGRTDIAVYRDGVWHLQQTQMGYNGIGFGTATDRTVHNSFVP